MQVLALDSAGTPDRWLKPKDAAAYYAMGQVAGEAGDASMPFHGGHNRLSGEQTLLEINSIIIIKGRAEASRRQMSLTVTRARLFARDGHTCAYCGTTFAAHKLDIEHIFPKSRGGPMSWMNTVTACKRCNNIKKNRTPEEAGMPLLYVPYIPNRHEKLILTGRNILADQMDFLKCGVPRHSRLL